MFYSIYFTISSSANDGLFPLSEYYFAYGSNMNPERMLDRDLGVIDKCAGRVSNMTLRFDKKDGPSHGHASVHYRRDSVVEGVLYRLNGIDEIRKLDVYETTPILYSRDLFAVECEWGVIYAWVYIANIAALGEKLKPEPWYLNHLLAGKPWLSEKYYQFLSSFVE